MINNWENMAKIMNKNRFGSCNGGWAYDAYLEIETLDTGKSIEIANIEGPAVITNIHSTQHFIKDDKLSEDERKSMSARGVILEIYYNGFSIPAVKVPFINIANFIALTAMIIVTKNP